MNVSVKELGFVVLFTVLSVKSLLEPSELLMKLFLSFTIVLIVVSIFTAIFARASRRTFCICFAASACVYLGFACITDKDGNSPRQVGAEVTTALLRRVYKAIQKPVGSTQLSRPKRRPTLQVGDADEVKNPFVDYEPFEIGSPTFNIGDSSQDSSLRPNGFSNSSEFDFEELVTHVKSTLAVEMKNDSSELVHNLAGFEPYQAMQKRFGRFMTIGHCVWAIALGSVAGHMASFFAWGTKNHTETHNEKSYGDRGNASL